MSSVETYTAAAKEHIDLAFHLYEAKRYVMAHYVAGLAVECVLRAHRLRQDPKFDSRHDLIGLSKLAKFFDGVHRDYVEQVYAALSEVATRWSNSHRYRSQKALYAWIRKAGLYNGIKGDCLKGSAKRIVDAARVVVTHGVLG